MNNSINQWDLTDICKMLHCYPVTAEYIFFSGVHGAFSKGDYMLIHKKRKVTVHLKYWNQINCFSDHNGMKFKI